MIANVNVERTARAKFQFSHNPKVGGSILPPQLANQRVRNQKRRPESRLF